MREAWTKCTDALDAIEQLKEDWDGLGASAPDSAVVRSAKSFLALSQRQQPSLPPTRVLASPDGSVVMEWQNDSSILEVEIEEFGRAMYTLELAGQRPRFWSAPFAATGPETTWEPRDQYSLTAA
jgi:hypothetical protein